MNIFITGKPGCGKSRLVQEIIKELEKKKARIAGILSPEIRKNGVRRGFEIVDLTTGKREVMASVEIKPAKVSKYGINVQGIDKIVEEFLKSFPKADYIVVDEIGRMEFFSEKFKQALEKIFSSNKPVIAAVHRNLAKRYESKGILLWLDREGFEAVKRKVLEKLGLAGGA